MRITSRQFSKRHVAGFTLVEMLLILFILGSLALLSTAVIDGVDEQARYDDTKQRLTLIKRAIVGDPTRTVNGEPEISGFVADMGRLPACLRELLDGKCADADPDPAAWALDAQSGIWAGWRGPYLETGSTRAFRDGWGNKNSDADEDAKNFGWQLSGMLTITSLGKDGEAGGNADDYTGDTSIEIEYNDFMVDLASWDEIEAEINYKNNDTDKIDLASTPRTLRLQFNYPENGELPLVWPADTAERDAATYLSSDFLLNAGALIPSSTGTIDVLNGSSITLSMPAILTGDILEVPANTTLTFSGGGSLVMSDRCPTSCKIVVPNNVEPDGSVTSVSFSADSIVEIPQSFVAPIKATFTDIDASGFAKLRITARPDSEYSANTLTLPGGATVSIAGGDWNSPYLILPTGAAINATVSEAFVLSGTKVTTAVSNDVFIVPFGTTSAGNTLTIPDVASPSFPVPIGIRSITLVCDDDGTIFNGTCPGSPAVSSVLVKLAPRQAQPLKPNPLIWNIE